MLYHVRMDVRIPHDMPADEKAAVVAREKTYAQEVQRSGRWPHLWRVVVEYSNVSIFDVESNDALHELLRTWLPRLSPDGEAWLVVGKNLGADSLQRWVEGELGLRCTREGSSKGFRVLRVTR